MKKILGLSGQIYICHIFEIKITIINNIAYCNINTEINIQFSILLQKLKLKKF